MHDLLHISGRLRDVLKRLEQATDDLEAIQRQGKMLANDDFLTLGASQNNEEN